MIVFLGFQKPCHGGNQSRSQSTLAPTFCTMFKNDDCKQTIYS